jgi:hypothetical protein
LLSLEERNTRRKTIAAEQATGISVLKEVARVEQ